MLIPRNTLVIVRILEQKEKTVGGIVVADADELYAEGEVLAVGPGMLSAAGGQSETFDLKPGQRVHVKYKKMERPGLPPISTGIRYVQDGEILYLFEQGSIVGIVSQPGEFPASEPVPAKAVKPIQLAN